MHRKVVTVLFCDVVGSTALGKSVDPEALQELLARYFERMKAIVESHGGSVEKFIGDAVMAVFGVPVVHEDDALPACRAAVEMRTVFPELGLQGRIGVNTGEVVTGTDERLAAGDAVNVGARLQNAAEPDEVLIGEATLELVRSAVETEPAEPLQVKGKSEPVPAHRLAVMLGETTLAGGGHPRMGPLAARPGKASASASSTAESTRRTQESDTSRAPWPSRRTRTAPQHAGARAGFTGRGSILQFGLRHAVEQGFDVSPRYLLKQRRLYFAPHPRSLYLARHPRNRSHWPLIRVGWNRPGRARCLATKAKHARVLRRKITQHARIQDDRLASGPIHSGVLSEHRRPRRSFGEGPRSVDTAKIIKNERSGRLIIECHNVFPEFLKALVPVLEILFPSPVMG